MKTVVFTSKGTINGEQCKRGDVRRVSSSIFKDLTEVQKCAKLKVDKDEPKRSSKSD